MATGIFKLRDQLLGLVQKAWTGSQTTPAVEYLVVAGGGGGGGGYQGGGGGAGGLLQGIVPITNGTSYTVTIGSGGTAGPSSTTPNGGNGQNSVFGNITAIGGGGAGGYGSGSPSSAGGAGAAGGSGGGAGLIDISQGKPGQGVFGQGNAGGSSNNYVTPYAGNGGGGAGTVGLNGGAIPANGGAGIASAISGTVTAYAGGGGGGTYGAAGGTGGVGGGGNGSQSANGTNGTTNTGGGGGGAGNTGYAGGSGGSGICIISYPDTYNAPTTLTGTYTASTSGSGSVLFNGTSQYLSTTYAPNLNSTSNFTIECWFNASSLVGDGAVCVFGSTAGSGSTAFYIYTSGKVAFGIVGSTEFSSATGLVALNTWYHLAAVRNGTSLNLYLNGTSVASTSSATTYCANATNARTIGFSGATSYFSGYISNARFTNTSVYTSTFTPSTIPLTAISGTQLLLNTVSGAQFADGSTNSYTVTAVASPTWNQLSPFATGLGYKNRVYTWTASGTVTF